MSHLTAKTEDRYCPLMSYHKQYTGEVPCTEECQFFRRGDCILAMAVEMFIDKTEYCESCDI